MEPLRCLKDIRKFLRVCFHHASQRVSLFLKQNFFLSHKKWFIFLFKGYLFFLKVIFFYLIGYIFIFLFIGYLCFLKGKFFLSQRKIFIFLLKGYLFFLLLFIFLLFRRSNFRLSQRGLLFIS